VTGCPRPPLEVGDVIDTVFAFVDVEEAAWKVSQLMLFD